MDLPQLSPQDIARFLQSQRILRLAMQDDGGLYIVPLGYVCLEGAIYCCTLGGKKTEILHRQPRVAFQIDDSASRNAFDWTSVTGEGDVEFISDPTHIARISPAFFDCFIDMPDWAARQYEQRMETGALIWLRIRPIWMTGRNGAPR